MEDESYCGLESQPDRAFTAMSLGGTGSSSRETALSKLDILRAKQINKLTKLNLAAVVFLFLYSFSAVIHANTYGKHRISVQFEGKTRTLPSFHLSAIHTLGQAIALGFQFLTYYSLGPMYFYRVFRNNRRPATIDQKMVGCMIVLNMLSNNPLLHIYLLNDYVLNKNNPSKKLRHLAWFYPLYTLTTTIMYACFTPGIILYLWVRLDQFRLLSQSSKRNFFWKIIFPKLLICSSYWIVQIIAFQCWKIVLGLLPFTSFICFFKVMHLTGIRHLPSIVVVSIITTMEIGMLAGLLISACRTNKALRAVDYFSHRSRIIGFKFFCFHNMLYLIFLTLFGSLLALALPSGQLTSWVYRSDRLFFYANLYYTGGLYLMQTVWMIITAFVSLPPDSVGLRGWFKPCTIEDSENLHHLDETQPVSFSLETSPVTNSSIFAFHDIMLMFNFSWLTYTSTREELDFYTSEIGSRDMFEVFVEEKFDTKVIIASLPDRIIIAFRGTKSSQNLKTDLKVNLVSLSDYLPTAFKTGENQSSNAKEWKRAKIHHGFGVSYGACAGIVLSRLEQLLTQSRRPVFLTGHSLGGALATVCSVDILMSDSALSNDQVTVVTFGSPKCGNKTWSKLYNRIVPSHWRIQIESDIVTMMPNLQYVHVGKTALLTTGGQMILDPSALDTSFTVKVPSINFHKKPAYKMAFSVVCEKHLNRLDTGIWEFPISEVDLRQWEKQCMITFSEDRATKLLTQNFHKEARKNNAQNQEDME